MYSLREEYKKNKSLHHAYLLEGDTDKVFKSLIYFFEKNLGIETYGNPDVVIQKFSSLSVDDARSLKDMASKKPLGERKIFIISADFLTREAQNSLLKLFEEPTPDTHFFIITRNGESVIPTLKSRLSIVSGGDDLSDSDLKTYAKNFLKLHPAARIEAGFLKELIEEKDKQKAIIFVDYITDTLVGAAGKNISGYKDAFHEILRSRNYLRDRSASVKLILENLSLLLPVLK